MAVPVVRSLSSNFYVLDVCVCPWEPMPMQVKMNRRNQLSHLSESACDFHVMRQDHELGASIGVFEHKQQKMTGLVLTV